MGAPRRGKAKGADGNGGSGAGADGANGDPSKARKPRRTARVVKREEAARGAIGAAAAALDPRSPENGELAALAKQVEADGGSVLGAYRDPLAGRPLLLAALPLDKVAPTSYQRDVSAAHVEKLADAIARTGLYLDPIIAFRDEGNGGWHTPNGGHRSEAMRRIGARAITALVVPDAHIAYRILALNTEKAHNLKERSLEAIRMARGLAALGGREADYAGELEDASLLTLGIAYEKRPRLSGSVYHPIVRRLEQFSPAPLVEALAVRERHADALLALDERVGAIIEALQARGIVSPYLRSFVVARLNPLRFAGRGAKADKAPDWDATLEKMHAGAERFDAGRIKPQDLARGGGPPEEEASPS